VPTRNGEVMISTPVDERSLAGLPNGEGLVLRMRGDGKRYTFKIFANGTGDFGTQQEIEYEMSFITKAGWNTVRLPFNFFRPVDPQFPSMDLSQATRFGLAYQARKQRKLDLARDSSDDPTSFEVELHFLKLLPGAPEPSFILLSKVSAAMSEEERLTSLPVKEAVEAAVRNSGLSYTIIRPGDLSDEPGGERALVFDQGKRITSEIGCVDVADVCLRSLHDVAGVNKSFEVCAEQQVSQEYELVGHVASQKNNYLSPALQGLEKNS